MTMTASDRPQTPPAETPQRRNPMGPVEFVALMAMTIGTVAFSIDSMLPALPQIAQELSPDNANAAQLILTSFILGMGIATFFTGPLSDTFGRKPIVVAGAVVYILGAAVAAIAPTLELVLLARLVQGLGAAGPRVVAIAIVRDLYSGREMAKLTSFIMMIFTLVPAVAPLAGSFIIGATSWRGIFGAFILFALVSVAWMMIRLPEPLPVDRRRPLRRDALIAAVKEMFAHPMVRLSMLVQVAAMTMLFASISMIQQIFDMTYGRADSFALWFAGSALIAGTGSIVNSRFVMRLGMRKIIGLALGAQVVLSAVTLLVLLFAGLSPYNEFYVYMAWQVTIFFQAGLTLGNLNALAMEPMGHIAGMAASIMGAVATVGAAVLTVPIGLSFDGSPLPLVVSAVVLSLGGSLLTQRMRQLERPE